MADEKQRREALLLIRILWAALLAGQLIFLVIMCFLLSRDKTPSTIPDRQMMLVFYVGMAMFLAGVPIGYFIRGQTYKRCWRHDAVTPAGYVGGNVVLLTICEGVAFFSLTTLFLSRQPWPYLLPMVLALAVQVLNFPHGRPMEPMENTQQL